MTLDAQSNVHDVLALSDRLNELSRQVSKNLSHPRGTIKVAAEREGTMPERNPYGYEFCIAEDGEFTHARIVRYRDHVRPTLCGIPIELVTERAVPASLFAKPGCSDCADALDEWASMEFDRGKEMT